eukprot:CAMPEP_0198457822 /NCGR_PEP_ID=MMETSP1453-20131121/32006_1 /TAXON_ID=1461543 ORGANISM="Unidentified sp., Strain RCC701" /NCGR_SAMPLE_ID=MMETSP1453 /ASSEMBLY_ACC=CAM_ASM_001118 /LENGTH=67 /DNA_ID=CAMNT_0044182593 /DNA_START=85 /DNA_END=284 /DNA_ORIENTATION=-
MTQSVSVSSPEGGPKRDALGLREMILKYHAWDGVGLRFAGLETGSREAEVEKAHAGRTLWVLVAVQG